MNQILPSGPTVMPFGGRRRAVLVDDAGGGDPPDLTGIICEFQRLLSGPTVMNCGEPAVGPYSLTMTPAVVITPILPMPLPPSLTVSVNQRLLSGRR